LIGLRRLGLAGLLLAATSLTAVAEISGPMGGQNPGGNAGGDLGGTFPNPAVIRLNGSTPAAIATSGSATDLVAGTVPNARISGAYNGFTSLGVSGTGTLGGLSVTGGSGTITQSTAANNASLFIDDSGVTGGFGAILRLKNSARDFQLISGGSAQSLGASGGLGLFDVTAGRYRWGIGSTGGVQLYDTAGSAAADLGAGKMSAPSTGGYYVNGSTSYGLGYAGSTASNCTSVLGLWEAGTNILCATTVDPIIDRDVFIAGNYVARMTGDWQRNYNTDNWISTNDQIQPGAFGVNGTWTAGDVATLTFNWNGGPGVAVSCKVNSNAGPEPNCNTNATGSSGTGSNVVADGLAYQIFNNALLKAAPIYVHNDYAAIANINGHTGSNGYPFLTTRRLYHAGTGWTISGGGTHPTQFVVDNPVNKLDGPIGVLNYRSRPSGSTEVPQNGDNVGTLQWLGATNGFPAGGINIAQIDVMVPDVATPTGEMDIHTTCAAGVTSNGCLRLVIKQGLSTVAADGSYNDNGQGTISTPAAMGYYVGSLKLLTVGTGYPTLWDGQGSGSIFLGKAADPINYYWQGSHRFANLAGSQQYASFGAAEQRMFEPLGRYLRVLGDTDMSTSLTVQAMTAAAGNANLELAGNNVGVYGKSGGGNCTYTGSGGWTCSSDERVKTNMQPLAGNLARLAQLRPITYSMIGGDGTVNYGFRAQEVQQVYPEIVRNLGTITPETPDGMLGIDYQGLIAPLVGGLQEAVIKYDSQNTAFANQLRTLTQRVTLLENVTAAK
jgi:hypothetical protein